MNKTLILVPVLALAFGSAAIADDKSHGHMKQDKAHGHMDDAKSMPMAAGTSAMAEGEIRRVSKGSKKLTIKHGEIENLDMPPMTMAFEVSDEKMLEMVKKGDSVKFRAESINGKMVVTEIAPQ